MSSVTTTPAAEFRPIQTQPYSLTFPEFYRGYAKYRRQVLARNLIVQLAVICGVLVWIEWYSGSWLFRTPIGWALIVFYVLMLLLTPARLRSSFKKIYSGRFVAEQTVATFSLEGVRIESATAQTLIRWNGFTHYEVRPDAIVVYRTPRIPIIIPRRAFDGSDFDAAVRWAQTHLGYETPARGFEVAVATPVESDRR